MCMRSEIFIIVSFFIIATTYAQNTITGSVTDTQNKGVPLVNVLLLNPNDSTLAKGVITNDLGEFRFEGVKSGSYIVSIHMLGFKRIDDLMDIKSDLNLRTYVIEEQSEVLDEAIVVAKKPLFEQKIDRLVINVQNNITSAGGTALEVLERSPGVSVNRARNSINLSGKEGVIIMVNGKVSRQPFNSIMQMLSSMNADNIEKIELITTPPAKYEAEGNAGIINIEIVKRTDIGTNGSLNLSLGYGVGDKEGINLNLNHRKEKVNLYGNISFNRDKTRESFINDRIVQEEQESSIFRTTSDRNPISTNYDGRIGLDYTLSKKAVLGGFVMGYYNDWRMSALNTGFERSIINPETLFRIENREKNQGSHLMANLNFSQKIGKSTEINFDLDYLIYENKNPTDYLNVFNDLENEVTTQEIVRAEKNTPVDIWVGRTDFSKKYGDGIKLQAGIKGTYSKLQNDVLVENLVDDVFVGNPDFSENSSLLEKIGAMYGIFEYAINERTQLNFGLRYEFTSTDLSSETQFSIVDIDYDDIFPTVFLSRKIGKETALNLSYGQRITRPSYNDLAPFIIFLDPNTFFLGNTALRPSRSDNLKLDMTYKKYMLSLQYNHESDAIVRYQPIFLEETNQQVFTSINLDYRDTYTTLLSVPIEMSNWWNVNVNFTGIYKVLNTQDQQKLSGSYVTLSAIQTFTLPKDFSMELSAYYQSESVDAISNISSFRSLSFGAQKVFNKKSKLRFSFDNIIGFEYDVFTASQLNLNYSINTRYKYEPRIFKLTYTYSFGNSILNSKRERETGSEDIKKRIE